MHESETPKSPHSVGSRSVECPWQPEHLGDLAAYLDGRLDPEQHEAVEVHLADCPACRQAIAACRFALAEASTTIVPAELLAAVRELAPRVDHANAPPARVLPWPLVRRWGLAAAASVAVCVTGYMVGTGAVDSASAADLSGTDQELINEMSFGLFGEDDTTLIVQLVLADEGDGT